MNENENDQVEELNPSEKWSIEKDVIIYKMNNKFKFGYNKELRVKLSKLGLNYER